MYSAPKRILVAIGLLAGGLVFLGSPQAEATPFGTELRSHQYNLCDAKCTGTPNPGHDLVTLLMTSEQPHTVSLNELCRTSAQTINSTMGIGMTYYTAKLDVTNCPVASTGHREFGNGAIVAGPNQVLDGGPFQTQEPTKATEVRGFACRRGDTYIGKLVSCSAHLKNQSPTTASTQSLEYAYMVAGSTYM